MRMNQTPPPERPESDPPGTDQPTGPIAPESVLPPPPEPVPPPGPPPPPPPTGGWTGGWPEAAHGGGDPTVWTVLSLVAFIAVPIGLFVPEHDSTFWNGAEAWGSFALLCAVLQLAPLGRSTLGWRPERSWTVGALGAGGLLLYWVLIVLPAVGRNTAFALTAGTAAACAAIWLAPGRRL